MATALCTSTSLVTENRGSIAGVTNILSARPRREPCLLLVTVALLCLTSCARSSGYVSVIDYQLDGRELCMTNTSTDFEVKDARLGGLKPIGFPHLRTVEHTILKEAISIAPGRQVCVDLPQGDLVGAYLSEFPTSEGTHPGRRQDSTTYFWNGSVVYTEIGTGTEDVGYCVMQRLPDSQNGPETVRKCGGQTGTD